MSKAYRNLWVFGDSFSTPGFCVDPTDSFWAAVGKTLGVDEIHNYSRAGNSIDSVMHLLVSESPLYNWEKDFFLIGIPPLARLTVVSDDDKKTYHKKVYDDEMTAIDEPQILCHHGLECRTFFDDPLAVRFEDSTWTEIQACRQIFLINQWLDRHDANYLVINLSKDFMTDLPATGKFLLEKCLSHTRNILAGKTYYSINHGINRPVDFSEFGWNGHHGAEGNQHFFKESLVPKMKLCGFI